MGFSGNQIVFVHLNHILRNSGLGAGARSPSAAIHSGRVLPGISLGLARPETALPRMSPGAFQSNQNRPTLPNISGAERHGIFVPQWPRFSLRPGNSHHLQRPVLVGSEAVLRKRSFLGTSVPFTLTFYPSRSTLT